MSIDLLVDFDTAPVGIATAATPSRRDMFLDRFRYAADVLRMVANYSGNADAIRRAVDLASRAATMRANGTTNPEARNAMVEYEAIRLLLGGNASLAPPIAMMEEGFARDSTMPVVELADPNDLALLAQQVRRLPANHPLRVLVGQWKQMYNSFAAPAGTSRPALSASAIHHPPIQAYPIQEEQEDPGAASPPPPPTLWDQLHGGIDTVRKWTKWGRTTFDAITQVIASIKSGADTVNTIGDAIVALGFLWVGVKALAAFRKKWRK